MTRARTFAVLAAATVALTLAPQVYEVASAVDDVRERHEFVRHVEFEQLEPLGDVVVDEIIEGVRVVSDDAERVSIVRTTVEKFDRAGWPLTNTEVRFDADGCQHGARAYHAEEDGHHVVVMCAETEYTLLHELAHVWSDLYLDDAERAEWVELRGLESWDDGDWGDRGTEHVAEIVAFGLYDTAHVPLSIGNNDYRTVIGAFEWLMGIPPFHRQRGEEAATGLATCTRVTVAAPRILDPADAPTGTVDTEPAAPAEYRFPLACGYPR